MPGISPGELNPRRIAEELNRFTRTRFREVTLTAGADSTTVTDPTVTEDSGIFLMALTANAKTEEHTSPFCLVSRVRGSFTISHINNAQTDRTFFWIAVGG